MSAPIDDHASRGPDTGSPAGPDAGSVGALPVDSLPVAESPWASAMAAALAEAEAAETHGDVPVGAVIVADGEIIAARHNERELTGDPTAHAEVLAIRDAAAARGSWRLDGCTIVVTLEPCAMCAGALVNARLDRLVYGAIDPKAGAAGSLMSIVTDPRLNHRLAVESGVRAERCGELLRQFFAARRR